MEFLLRIGGFCTLAVELGTKWLNRFCQAMRHWERGAAGIEAGRTQGWRGLARVARRRPWEPPQARWGSPRQPRTTAESPAAAQKKPIESVYSSTSIQSC